MQAGREFLKRGSMSTDKMKTVFGSTPDGFVPRRLADIQTALNEKLAEIVDPASGEKPF